nr:retrotransposon protein, putative, Ty1-copia subclass [Tanacetum cinerariifolium]
MPLRIRTQSPGRLDAESRGRGMGRQVGRGGGKGRRPREGNDERVDYLNGQGNDQGMGANEGIEGVNGNVEGDNGGAPDFLTIITQQLQNFLPAMPAQSFVLVKRCKSLKLHCEITPWSGLAMLRILIGFMIGEICRMVAVTKPKTMQKAVQISGALTDEAVGNGSIKKVEKRGNVGEPSKDKNGMDDNRRTRNGNVFGTTVSPVGRENMGAEEASMISSPPKRDNPTKDSVCHHYKEVGHWTRNYPSYEAKLKKRKNASVASTSKTFKVFQNEVENQLGKMIKAIQSDRGDEYLSLEFVNHMKSCGIVSQLTPPYTPQHNGVSEKRNKTLLDMVQFMMNLTTLLKSCWGYSLESVPTKNVERMSYEIWHGKAPKLSYLRVWG